MKLNFEDESIMELLDFENCAEHRVFLESEGIVLKDDVQLNMTRERFLRIITSDGEDDLTLAELELKAFGDRSPFSENVEVERSTHSLLVAREEPPNTLMQGGKIDLESAVSEWILEEQDLNVEDLAKVSRMLELSEEVLPKFFGQIVPPTKAYSQAVTEPEENIGPSALTSLYVRVQVNDRPFSIMLDTGSAVTQVPSAICALYGWHIYSCHPDQVMIKLMSIFGETKPMEPKFTYIHVKLNGVSYKHCAWVVPTEQNDSILLGMDFLFGKPLLFSFYHGVLMSSPINYIDDAERAKGFQGPLYDEYRKLKAELKILERALREKNASSLTVYKQTLVRENKSVSMVDAVPLTMSPRAYEATLKQRQTQVFLQLMLKDEGAGKWTHLLPPTHSPEYLTGCPLVTKVEEFQDSWESMAYRACQMEKLDRFKQELKRERREMTAHEKMLCRAVEEECKPRKAALKSLDVQEPTYSVMGSATTDLSHDAISNHFVQGADEMIAEARKVGISLRLQKDLILQPGYAAACKLAVTGIPDGLYICEPNKTTLVSKYVLMQNCLTKCSQGIMCTVLFNTSKEEQIIEKGTIIAQISTDVEEVKEVENISSLITSEVMAGCAAKNSSVTKENPWMDLIRIDNPAVTPEMKREFLSRLQEVNSVLPTPDRPLGRYTGVAHEIITVNHPPITCRPYKVPPHKREAMKEACQEMQKLGVASPTTSPWAFPCLLVKKKDGGWRIVADFRKLNDITEIFYFPLPNIDDSIHYIQDARWFTSIDLANAFWQIPMSQESCKKAAFCTPDGNFQYNVMAMGLCNASSTFQAVMNETLSEEQMVICLTFLDDCLI